RDAARDGRSQARAGARAGVPMTRALLAIAIAVVLMGAGPASPTRPGAETPPALESTRALAEGLKRTGRAEVTLAWDVADMAGGPPQRMKGALAVEPPDRARLDVAKTGERITLRSDGGEWLQPAVHQLVILKPRHSVGAMRWWRLLAGGTDATERKLANGRYRLLVPATPTSDADSAEASPGAGGRPERRGG